MAGHGDSKGGATAITPEQDLAAHRKSYDGFMWWLKIGAGVAFVVGFVATVIVAS